MFWNIWNMIEFQLQTDNVFLTTWTILYLWCLTDEKIIENYWKMKKEVCETLQPVLILVWKRGKSHHWLSHDSYSSVNQQSIFLVSYFSFHTIFIFIFDYIYSYQRTKTHSWGVGIDKLEILDLFNTRLQFNISIRSLDPQKCNHQVRQELIKASQTALAALHWARYLVGKRISDWNSSRSSFEYHIMKWITNPR